MLWIKHFLIGRKFNVKQRIVFRSSIYDVASYVPQRSKLGPLLYIIYANDITDLNKFAKIKMYADDHITCACINNEMDRVKFHNYR